MYTETKMHQNVQLSDIGEFELIKQIASKISVDPLRVKVGIGDDTCVLSLKGDKLLLVTTDMSVEGVHFDCRYSSPYEIGYKAMVANLSDIAAMGGVPKDALISIGLRGEMSIDYVRELQRGIQALSNEFGVNIVGGDTVASHIGIVINITVLGEVEEEHLVLRSGAKSGEYIVVTNRLGSSQAGLELLRRGITSSLTQQHLMPRPKVREAQVIVQNHLATAMIDLSDGLIGDVYQLISASGIGAELFRESIPISDVAIEVAKESNACAIDFALYGGEDYELLFTVPPQKLAQLSELNFECTVIGKTIDEGIWLIDKINGKEKLVPKGYEHFKINSI